ncbi:hypothetical protein C7T96_09890 [Nitratireductor sp. StC3]|nr:hypothetical protein C7T96_09890 [Nitratireductor sp. StC3]
MRRLAALGACGNPVTGRQKGAKTTAERLQKKRTVVENLGRRRACADAKTARRTAEMLWRPAPIFVPETASAGIKWG